MKGWCFFLVLAVLRAASAQYRPLYYFINPLISTKAAAVIRANGTGAILGFMEFEQPSLDGPVTIRGSLRGISQGDHGFHIHQFGDVTEGCKSAGPHFNPSTWTHGGQSDAIRHIGDLGNIRGDRHGQVLIDLQDDRMTLHGRNNIIGRSIIVHALRDDLGRGGNAESLITGNAGPRILCGIIGLVDEIIDWNM